MGLRDEDRGGVRRQREAAVLRTTPSAVASSRSPSTATTTSSVPRFAAIVTPPRCSTSTPASSSAAASVVVKRGSVRSDHRRRSAMSRRCRSSSSAWWPCGGSDQSSFDRWNVSGSCGSGTSSGFQPIFANSAMRPFAVASPRSCSGWEVKNCHGVDAPHSSPMNSIGVNGVSRFSTAPTASRAGERVCDSRSPAARLPIWSWSCAKVTSRLVGIVSRSIGRPWCRSRKLDHVPSWTNPWVSARASTDSPRSPRSSRSSRRSARRGARGGSRRSTARRARSRAPPAT